MIKNHETNSNIKKVHILIGLGSSIKSERIILKLPAFDGFVGIIAFDGFEEVRYEIVKFFLFHLALRLKLLFHFIVVLIVG
jgi:hypothetical protein